MTTFNLHQQLTADLIALRVKFMKNEIDYVSFRLSVLRIHCQLAELGK